ncbi:dTMP kinase [Anabaena sp. FACHB-709]|uniref:Thymidylate kinase n=3 Tax=Nostocaceae TaxID=1162 RepID=KTHY_NOSS1|nr:MULTISPECIES: dTMP kinase [Nostocaceae]Q8YN62.1 RecName: Full=Thymidylate kinase; AltName: Full=dTMP kinase [Nostoc sp. PCC 7120 = FACHB-418]BAY70319.1 thymidylate kinase [Trichormus variabilis NIES-23]HBW30709.1 thymidylate kinase [Nostoc sp. UBA8866]AWF73613.1 thymidylate kinase [Nostoc sp. PCC 7120 = FACHB-418]MBD2173490.1 dTMP kinase [Anabaena cylindrica FACHB-318]MBD2265201.1 dTMP kinase [Anabaena sp. FACHB-709]
MGGRFIVFEGVEGCGKTSQMQLCAEWLQSLGISVVLTREPGGTELGLDLRRLLLQKAEDKPIAEVTELLLYAADRAQHVAQELKPKLAQGKYILCDRYVDSTIAYQGYGRNLDMNLIHQLNDIATGGLTSDITIWLDVDVEVGLARKRGDNVGLDRIEQETIAFHRRVQQGYADLAASSPKRIIRVDGQLSKETVHKTIQEILSVHLKQWL